MPPRRAMYLLGHADPTITMTVYQQVLDMGGAGVETLERVLGGRLDDVGQILYGRQPDGEWSLIGHSTEEMPSTTTSSDTEGGKKYGD